MRTMGGCVYIPNNKEKKHMCVVIKKIQNSPSCFDGDTLDLTLDFCKITPYLMGTYMFSYVFLEIFPTKPIQKKCILSLTFFFHGSTRFTSKPFSELCAVSSAAFCHHFRSIANSGHGPCDIRQHGKSTGRQDVARLFSVAFTKPE